MRLTVPPEVFEDAEPLAPRIIFLAGGITGCPDWQSKMVAMMELDDVVFLNPRRPDFPIGDPNAAPLQIAWEHNHLRKATDIVFWFPKETLCPIVLYELGAWTAYRQMSADQTPKIFIGCHKEYQRRQDVIIQTRLSVPGLHVRDSLVDLIVDVRGKGKLP